MPQGIPCIGMDDWARTRNRYVRFEFIGAGMLVSKCRSFLSR